MEMTAWGLTEGRHRTALRFQFHHLLKGIAGHAEGMPCIQSPGGEWRAWSDILCPGAGMKDFSGRAAGSGSTFCTPSLPSSTSFFNFFIERSFISLQCSLSYVHFDGQNLYWRTTSDHQRTICQEANQWTLPSPSTRTKVELLTCGLSHLCSISIFSMCCLIGSVTSLPPFGEWQNYISHYIVWHHH